MRVLATLKAIVSREPQRFVLPRELMTTDRVLQRWAVSSGTGLPNDDWDGELKAKPPPLSDDVAIMVDEIIIASPPRTRELITRWYKTPHPVQVMARQLHMTERNVYRYHSVALYYMRDRFESCGPGELIRLIQMIGD